MMVSLNFLNEEHLFLQFLRNGKGENPQGNVTFLFMQNK